MLLKSIYQLDRKPAGRAKEEARYGSSGPEGKALCGLLIAAERGAQFLVTRVCRAASRLFPIERSNQVCRFALECRKLLFCFVRSTRDSNEAVAAFFSAESVGNRHARFAVV